MNRKDKEEKRQLWIARICDLEESSMNNNHEQIVLISIPQITSQRIPLVPPWRLYQQHKKTSSLLNYKCA